VTGQQDDDVLMYVTLLCCCLQASDQYLLEGLKRLCEAALAEVRPAAVGVVLAWSGKQSPQKEIVMHYTLHVAYSDKSWGRSPCMQRVVHQALKCVYVCSFLVVLFVPV